MEQQLKPPKNGDQKGIKMISPQIAHWTCTLEIKATILKKIKLDFQNLG